MSDAPRPWEDKVTTGTSDKTKNYLDLLTIIAKLEEAVQKQAAEIAALRARIREARALIFTPGASGLGPWEWNMKPEVQRAFEEEER